MRKIAMALLAVLLAACTSIDCPVESMVYTIYDLQKPDGTPDTLTVDTMSVWIHRADGSDTIVYNQLFGPTAYTMSLPISYTQPEDTFYLLTKDTLGHRWRDTIRVKKDNFPHFESVDCQATYFHRITAVFTTRHLIDSLIINNPDVNYDLHNEHFHLRLKARY